MFTLNGNWVDLAIIVVLFVYSYNGIKSGFWFVLGDFISFLASILISLRLYKFTAGFFSSNFNLHGSFANAFGFILTAVMLEIVISYFLAILLAKIPKKILKNKVNTYFGFLPGLLEGLVFVAFILSAIVSLPIRPEIKRDVSESKLGTVILQQTAVIEKSINKIFGGAFNDALTYLTVEPKTKTTVPIKSGKANLVVDEASERQMVALVNEERRKAGLSELTVNSEITVVSRNYARDMWERHYFSHYSPEGEDAGDRLQKAGISYSSAGENLAMAPTVSTAHNGLMNSEGHRANILEPKFKKIGIGVIDNGIYGKIFVQVFTN